MNILTPCAQHLPMHKSRSLVTSHYFQVFWYVMKWKLKYSKIAGQRYHRLDNGLLLKS